MGRETVDPIVTYLDHAKSINCMAVSKDDSTLVTGSDDCTIRVWNIVEKIPECFGILKGHSAPVTSVEISDIYVISSSFDLTIRKYDIMSCDCLFVYEGHESRICRIMCTGEFILSSSQDRTARLWRFDHEHKGLDDGYAGCIKVYKGHTKMVYPMIYIPDGFADGIDEPGIHPNDKLITGSADGTAKSWSLETGKIINEFKGHRGTVMCMACDPQGTVLYTGSSDTTIRHWDIASGSCQKIIEGHSGAIMCLRILGDDMLVAGDANGYAKCWLRKGGDYAFAYNGHRNTVLDIRLHKGKVYTACGDTCIREFKSNSNDSKKIFVGHKGAVTGIRFKGRRMYSVSTDGTFMTWELVSKKAEHEMDDEEKEEYNEVKRERRAERRAEMKKKMKEEKNDDDDDEEDEWDEDENEERKRDEISEEEDDYEYDDNDDNPHDP